MDIGIKLLAVMWVCLCILGHEGGCTVAEALFAVLLQ